MRLCAFLPLAFLCCSFAQSQAVPEAHTPSLDGKATRSSAWAGDISSGRVRQERHGHETSVRRYYNSQKMPIRVIEPDQDGKPQLETDYVWSSAGNLIQVTQHGLDSDIPRVRKFVYDEQNHLTTALNPESGTITYTYNNSSVASRTDARGITTTYVHDNSGHLIGKQYSNGEPSAKYVYDGTSGNLLSSYLQTPAGRVEERTYHYNAQGKLDRITQNITAEHTLSFVYDTSGHLTNITYPDGRVVRQTWDSGGHISSIADQNGVAYLSGLQYDSTGSLSKGYLGSNLTESLGYTSAGSLEYLRLDLADKTILSKQYAYTSDGSISSISDALLPENGFTYRYDDLQRVAGYTRLDGTAEHSYGYDAFGNLSIDASSPYAYNASNRIASMQAITYDVSGDMTNDGRHSYQYDAEGRISQVDEGSVAYLYSAEGNRIQKQFGNSITEAIWVGNQLLAEQTPDGAWVDYLYVGGKRIVAIRPSGATYYVSDDLGITRMELSSSGTILTQSDMTPFGQLLNRQSDAEEVPFTGGEQYDAETGLYSYKYRSYSPLLGRWMSSDPSGEKYANLKNPQSLNLYSYVINDPLKFVDELGLCLPPSPCNDGSCTWTWSTTQPNQLVAPNVCGPGYHFYAAWDCYGTVSDCEYNAGMASDICYEYGGQTFAPAGAKANGYTGGMVYYVDCCMKN
jgi:RHS repeat-associated protein